MTLAKLTRQMEKMKIENETTDDDGSATILLVGDNNLPLNARLKE